MNSELVVDFLAPTLLSAGWEVVQSALSINALPDWEQLPAVFAHPVNDQALSGNTQSSGGSRQPVSERFAIVHVCAISELSDRRKSVHALLLSNHLPGYIYGTEFVEGSIMDLNRTAIWWRDIYAAQSDWRYP